VRPGGSAARGFSLIELLITIAIVAIVTTIAVGGYRQYVRRAGRVDASSALLRLASAQEKFYAQNGQYADDGARAAAPPAGLGIEGTERGYYDLALALAAGGAAVGYTATATVNAGENQADDEDCWIFGINERGLRTAASRTGDTGAAVTERCWK
jgi:type IV pilus assembly protein PilE